ncbi:NADP-dependent oxidoreductase domain-containing protein [Aspergillus insuetus]
MSETISSEKAELGLGVDATDGKISNNDSSESLSYDQYGNMPPWTKQDNTDAWDYVPGKDRTAADIYTVRARAKAEIYNVKSATTLWAAGTTVSLAMASLEIQLIFGGASFGGMGSEFVAIAETTKALSILAKNDVRTIDTATVYINSEDLLGQAGVSGLGFSIDTKYPGGFAPRPSTKDDVIARAEESLRQLNIDHINIYYIHAPERRVALKELLGGMNTLHQAGKFKQLGLSSFLPEEVEKVIRIAKEHNYVLPSVYQGNYNAVSRHAEARLLPILRKHNISYYAHSPIAGVKYIMPSRIIYYTSVPGTPEQNGFAKCSGGVIIART